MSYDSKNTIGKRNKIGSDNSKLSLPDFDTLRDLAKNDPEGLEELRPALCNKVIDEAPEHAKPRLKGLMFQINSRRQIASSNLEACKEISSMMHESLHRMQAMLKDLRSMQSESILLSTRHYDDALGIQRPAPSGSAEILPFNKT